MDHVIKQFIVASAVLIAFFLIRLARRNEVPVPAPLSAEREDEFMQTKDSIYGLYEQIFASGLPLSKKKTILRSLFVGEQWSWRVVAISHGALKAYADNDFKPTTGLQRHHFEPFANTAKFMLDREIALGAEEFWDLIDMNERVHLVTKLENITCDYEIIKINPELGLFANRLVGWRYGKDEQDFLRSLWKAWNGKKN